MESIPGTFDFDTYHKAMKRYGESNWATGSTPGGAISSQFYSIWYWGKALQKGE